MCERIWSCRPNFKHDETSRTRIILQDDIVNCLFGDGGDIDMVGTKSLDIPWKNVPECNRYMQYFRLDYSSESEGL